MVPAHSGSRHSRSLAASVFFPVVLLLAGENAFAGQITLAWNPNTEADLAGYRLHIGDSSRVYHTAIDVGNVTSYTVSDLQDGRFYYFAITAYDTSGAESDFSVEVSGTTRDATPPTISAVSASSVTGSGATITWLTNDASDSQVEYGPTSAYGSTTPLDGTMVTTHTVALTGLTDATLYHYRVRSRDAAGNLATSGDFTFTTTDGTAPIISAVAASGTLVGQHTLSAIARDAAGNVKTSADAVVSVQNLPGATSAGANSSQSADPSDGVPPSVSITGPVTGVTVAGTVTLAALASDDVGVAGIHFNVNGVPLGPELTTAPYTIEWDVDRVRWRTCPHSGRPGCGGRRRHLRRHQPDRGERDCVACAGRHDAHSPHEEPQQRARADRLYLA